MKIGWGIQDNKRDIDNVVDKTLYANVSDAEYADGARLLSRFCYPMVLKSRTAHAGMNDKCQLHTSTWHLLKIHSFHQLVYQLVRDKLWKIGYKEL